MHSARGGVSTFAGGQANGQPKKQSLQSTSASPNGPQPQKSIIEIYTDWANHYLEKLKNRHKIKDLQTELSDGLILSDVIEAVTGQKVPDITRKPKTSSQMESNIQSSLTFLLARGVSVNDIQAKEVRDGNLKAILGLFFQLSRYKQQQKMLMQQQASPMKKLNPNLNNCDHATNNSSPHHIARTSTPKIPSVPPSPSRSNHHTVPNVSNSCIPSPSRKLQSSQAMSSNNGMGNRSMLPAPKVGRSTAGNPAAARLPPTGSSIPNGGIHSATPTTQFQQYHPNSGIHMGGSRQTQIRGLGKRTSSSSGFSSGRSVSSGVSGESSSVSTLSSDTNFPSPSALRRINENVSASSVENQQSPSSMKPQSVQGHQSQQKSSISGIKRFSRATTPASSPAKTQSSSIALPGTVGKTVSSNVIARNSASPNRSPKLARAAAAVVSGNTEMKDYGPIDAHQMDNYPPHAFNSSTGKSSSLVKPMNGSPGTTSLTSQSRIPNPSSANTQNQSNINSTSSSPSKMPQPYSAVRSKSNLTSASGIGSRRIPATTSGISSPKSLNAGSKIPPPTNISSPAAKLNSVNQQALPQGCSVKPLPKNETSLMNSGATSKNDGSSGSSIIQNGESTQPAQPTTSENDEATAMMTASFHSRTCSLPRQKPLSREDGSPGPSCVNVAVVSPMPTAKSPKVSKTKAIENKQPTGDESRHSSNGNQATHSTEGQGKQETMATQCENENGKKSEIVRKLSEDTSSDDPLNNIVPMAPLGLYGAIGDQTSAISSGKENMDSHLSKQTLQDRTKESCIMNGMKQQHHLPFSSRSNGANGAAEKNGVSNDTFNQQPNHQDLVAFNASVASMTPHNMNSGKTYKSIRSKAMKY